jgi:ubiquitin C-terminal hydrolase
VLNKPYVESVEAGPNDQDEKVSAEAWERHLLRNKSIVVDLFQVVY